MVSLVKLEFSLLSRNCNSKRLGMADWGLYSAIVLANRIRALRVDRSWICSPKLVESYIIRPHVILVANFYLTTSIRINFQISCKKRSFQLFQSQNLWEIDEEIVDWFSRIFYWRAKSIRRKIRSESLGKMRCVQWRRFSCPLHTTQEIATMSLGKAAILLRRLQ